MMNAKINWIKIITISLMGAIVLSLEFELYTTICDVPCVLHPQCNWLTPLYVFSSFAVIGIIIFFFLGELEKKE